MGIYKWSFLRSDMETRFSDYLERVRSARPLVHHITNYVTVNDCANICICAGGSPVMTDGEDVADMVAIASASVLNIGTLNERTVHSMEVAASVASNRIPFLLDPVGAGATQYRTDTSEMLMRFHPTVIKGNAGEIGVLSGIGGDVKGVDSHGSEDAEEAVRSLSRSTGSIVVATGAVDYIADGDTATGITLPAGRVNTITFDCGKPYTARSLTLKLLPSPAAYGARLEAEIDGTYTTVATFTVDRSNPAINVGFDPYAPVTVSFAATTARRFRLVTDAAAQPGGVAEAELSAQPRIASHTGTTTCGPYRPRSTTRHTP